VPLRCAAREACVSPLLQKSPICMCPAAACLGWSQLHTACNTDFCLYMLDYCKYMVLSPACLALLRK
jgi:hypothetical protein